MSTEDLEVGGGSSGDGDSCYGGRGGGYRSRDINMDEGGGIDRDDEDDGYRATGSVPLSKGGGVGTCVLPGGAAGGVFHMTGGGNDTQGVWGLL